MTDEATFRSQQLGSYTVRELPMRVHLQVIEEWPEAGIKRAAAYLGHAVSNGTGQPLGRDGVLELPAAFFNQLMDVYMQVSRREGQTPTAAPAAAGTEGGPEGNV